MKKVIKNYLAKLQENDKKGFSLVELIIVMAIMAILVGVVASQVLPYMDKSRQSKDQQVLSSICTDLVSATAQSGKDLKEVNEQDISATGWGSGSGDADWATVETIYAGLQTSGQLVAYNKLGLKSKEAKKKTAVKFDYDATTGEISVYLDGHKDEDADSSKYIVYSSSK
ncbi:MAG: prepilin-type N-terminal cleavage/methylation domain-containing protein [Lachnospiraceae bacterium]|nr:prepilin-type N-terminal cleavage/methylation domain-containing protein [Lachnospiraceae bacterium]